MSNVEGRKNKSNRPIKQRRKIEGGPKSKPLPNDQKIVLNRIKAYQLN